MGSFSAPVTNIDVTELPADAGRRLHTQTVAPAIASVSAPVGQTSVLVMVNPGIFFQGTIRLDVLAIDYSRPDPGNLLTTSIHLWPSYTFDVTGCAVPTLGQDVIQQRRRCSWGRGEWMFVQEVTVVWS